MRSKLTLYGTSACHLCEQAEALLQPWIQQGLIVVELVDISECDSLLERYGVRIPVLRCNATGQELGWPFDADQLQRWL